MRTFFSHFLTTTALLALAGCSSSNSDLGQYVQILRQAYNNSFHNLGITRDQAAAIPYASLGYRVNGSSENILVLATDENGQQIWTASSHIVLTVRDGRIVRTVGLKYDLGASVPNNSGTLPPLVDALKASYRSSRAVDLPDIRAYSTMLTCTTSAVGPRTITIIGAAISTIRVDETCRSEKQHWSFTDNYWVDAKTGFVWRAIQHVHPATVVQTEIFRPPG